MLAPHHQLGLGIHVTAMCTVHFHATTISNTDTFGMKLGPAVVLQHLRTEEGSAAASDSVAA
jgi:hypothetical protein